MENDSEETNNSLGGNGPVLRKQKGETEDDTPKKLGNAENSKPEFVGLERKLGLFSGISLIVGTMIGSGIFASPRYVMENSGSVGLTLIVWSLCGLLAMFGALSYAELGTMIPLSGAEYAYLLHAFGPLPAFLFSWTAVIVLKPSLVAIICLAFGAYVGRQRTRVKQGKRQSGGQHAGEVRQCRKLEVRFRWFGTKAWSC